jgi:hypothetical protein
VHAIGAIATVDLDRADGAVGKLGRGRRQVVAATGGAGRREDDDGNEEVPQRKFSK